MYDPLVDGPPGPRDAPEASYWQQHTRADFPECVDAPEEVEFAIIGAGYTGLNAARVLAENGRSVAVFEANQLAWGCSSRNAGFVMKSTGRLGLSAWAQRFGEETARGIAGEHQTALQLVEETLRECPQHGQRQHGGYLKIAHRPSAIAPLKQQYEQLKRFNQPVEWLTREELSAIIASPQAHSALRFTDCFALNPMLLAAATARRASSAGAQLVEHCPVTAAVSLGGKGVYLQTAKGAVRARKLLVCSNGYTSGQLLPELASRSLPVLSSIITTPPLTETQVESIRLSPQYAMMDTRILKYYFRLLPDNRLLFGGRGAIQGKSAGNPLYAKRLLAALHQTFPQLREVNEWEHFWSGWVSVSLDDYPRIGNVKDNIYASMGYCGAGVSFTALAGQRLAEAAMGHPLPELPYYQSQLKPFPLPRFRRLGQWLYYHYGRLRD
ncbi:FAD-binding oxidoreductase [Idiomarina sp. HP20-50]|uniref:NAD(P)/FAD-dependent oxidoreductase n=1 Tax=Idiomarina sp. HP20-50 TaxID=3070813 RepID=UPI00294AC402|nr:FAD-binding oxidoreductase [Idiomarina sp. HP20-50]MDV6316056.1 FAD-binding oxidoreductase [Idiomarina sp. HP20-50]